MNVRLYCVTPPRRTRRRNALRRFAIDGLHRLQTASGIWGSYSYVYDPINNLRSRGGASSLSYNYNASSNRLTSVSGATARSYSYNANGEVTGDGSKSYGLNTKGQITTISGVADYRYDANGKRIKSTTTANGRIEYALYSLSGQLRLTAQAQATTTDQACLTLNCLLADVGQLLSQLLGLGSVSIASTTDYLHLQGKPLAELQLSGSTTTVTYLHPDLLGSPRMATNSAGQTLWQEHYDPYGKKLNSVAEKLGYTGHAYDQESGLTYAQARFYDGAVGRFLSIDPIAFSGAPFTFNRYSYANNNPYRYTDPTGMAGCETQTTGTNICGGSTSSPLSSSPGPAHGAGDTRKEAMAAGRGNDSASASGANGATAGGSVSAGTLGGLGAAAAVSSESLALALSRVLSWLGALSLSSDSVPGEAIYRVYGGAAELYGRSWTPVDPRTVPDYRNAAGLPNSNSGTNLGMGYLQDRTGVIERNTLPLHGNTGGIPEYLVPSPETQIRIMWSEPVHPPF